MASSITVAGPGLDPHASLEVGNHLPLVLIAGPCQIETLDHALRAASLLRDLADQFGMGFIYKSSYDKANRTSGDTTRGPGMAAGLRILEEVKRQASVLTTTDVHTEDEAHAASMVVDLVQVPALLSRQTDLLAAAGKWGRAVSVKKLQGADAAPWAAGVVGKVNNPNLILIERGTTFGYGLVNDFTRWPDMRLIAPVVFDATHSVQMPSALGKSSGGARRLVPDLAAAAVAVGIAGVFIECHEDPDRAPSDGPCMVPFAHMPSLLARLQRIDEVTKS